MTFKISVEDRFKKVAGTALSQHRLNVSLERQMHVLATRYFNDRNYSRSRLFIDCCLEEYECVFDTEYRREFHALSGEHNNKARLRLLSALIHSDEPKDIHCAITILEGGLLLRSISTTRKKKLLYLLSVGYYRVGDN